MAELLACPTIGSYDGPVSAEPRPALQVTPPARLRRLPSWLVNQLALRSTRLIGELLPRPGVRADFAVLSALEELGPMSQAELGRRLGLDRSDVVAVLDRLEDAGSVARAQDPSDRRRNVITLTRAGSRVLADLERHLDDIQKEFLAPLTRGERAQLTTLLQRLVDHHGAAGRPGAKSG